MIKYYCYKSNDNKLTNYYQIRGRTKSLVCYNIITIADTIEFHEGEVVDINDWNRFISSSINNIQPITKELYEQILITHQLT